MRPANWTDPKIDLNVIGTAFQMVFKRWSEYALLGFITMGLTIVCVIPAYIAMLGMMIGNRRPDFTQILMFYPVIYASILVGFALSYPFHVGIANFTIVEARTGNAQLSDAWAPLKSYGKLAAAGLVFMLAQFVASVCGCMLGGIAFAGFMIFFVPILANEGLGPVEAMKESFERTKSQWLMAIVVMIVSQILSGVGEIACIIGIVVTYPLLYVIPTLIYLNGFPTPQPQGSAASPYPRGDGPGYGIGSGPPPPAQREDEPPRP